jgi:hypothetical protein
MQNRKIKKLTKAPCRVCLRETNHTILASHALSGTDEISELGEIWWSRRYEMLACCGCDSVLLRETSSWSEDPEPSSTYYPPPVSRSLPGWRHKLPHRLNSLLGEVYAALHADSRTLALMGARTLVDVVILDKVGDVGTFPEKLEKMEQDGLVGRQNREFLAVALDAGSAAAHRGYSPKIDQLNQVMDIVENLLQAVYVLHGAAEELKKSTPQRGAKSGKTSSP